MTDELTSLRAADPVPASHPALRDQPLDERASAELEDLVGGAPVWPRRARWAAVAAGAAALAVLAFTVGLPVLGGGPAPVHAATPPLLTLHEPPSADAPAELRRLAAVASRVAEQPGARRASSWQTWSLTSRVDGELVTSAVVPQDGELAWREDGSGSLTVKAGEPYFPSQAHRRAWERVGAPVAPGSIVERHEYRPGELPLMFPTPPPNDPAALEAYLRTGHPGAEPGADGTAELFVAIGDLQREWRLTPPQRAALLQVVAEATGVSALGSTVDRLGRDGEAFAVESDLTGLPTRYVLVVDPDDGRVLAAEQWLTTDGGALDVPVPSVISYTAWRH